MIVIRRLNRKWTIGFAILSLILVAISIATIDLVIKQPVTTPPNPFSDEFHIENLATVRVQLCEYVWYTLDAGPTPKIPFDLPLDVWAVVSPLAEAAQYSAKAKSTFPDFAEITLTSRRGKSMKVSLVETLGFSSLVFRSGDYVYSYDNEYPQITRIFLSNAAVEMFGHFGKGDTKAVRKQIAETFQIFSLVSDEIAQKKAREKQSR